MRNQVTGKVISGWVSFVAGNGVSGLFWPIKSVKKLFWHDPPDARHEK